MRRWQFQQTPLRFRQSGKSDSVLCEIDGHDSTGFQVLAGCLNGPEDDKSEELWPEWYASAGYLGRTYLRKFHTEPNNNTGTMSH